jgi:hypothetical protein
MSGKIVAYYRDDPSPRYGLTLEQQAECIRRHADAYDAEVIGEYRDVRGVRWKYRPELMKAIERAQAEGARLVFPTLEGPFGNAAILGILVESGVAFGVCGRPEITEKSLAALANLARRFSAAGEADGPPTGSASPVG